MAEQDLIKLITDFKESLEREIHALDTRMTTRFDRLDARFDAQAVRLDRLGGSNRAGQVWISRQSKWAEKIDGILESLTKRIAELERRTESKGDAQ